VLRHHRKVLLRRQKEV